MLHTRGECVPFDSSFIHKQKEIFIMAKDALVDIPNL